MPLCAAAVEGLLEMRAERRENIAIQMGVAGLLSTEALVNNSPVPRLCVQRGDPKRLFAGYIIACNFSVQEANGAVGVHSDVVFVRYKDNRVPAFVEFIKQAHDFAAGG